MYVDIKPKQIQGAEKIDESTIDWRAILYHGHDQESVPLATQAAERVEENTRKGVTV